MMTSSGIAEASRSPPGTAEGSGSRGRILVVEDDAGTRGVLEEILAEDGYRVEAVSDGEAALQVLDGAGADVVLLDLHLPKVSGINVLAALPNLQTDARFIVMTAFGTVDSAVEAMKLGAFDYVRKPVEEDELLHLVERAWEDVALRRELADLRRSRGGDGLQDLVGKTPPMQRLYRMIQRVARTRATVLILGETGTGKELVARAVHDLSDRSRKAFVPVNCSALPGTLLESELFGFVKGSFTGAVQSRRGLIEEAAGGTLFLDEVSTLSEDIQVKLLRVLQDRKVQRIGSRSPTPVDFRLVVATNSDLGEAVRRGTFREDLYYRLHVFPIQVPPLRDRRDDIPLLAQHFRLRFAQEHELEVPPLTSESLSRMMTYDWPGNVRELENFVERAVIMAPEGEGLRWEPDVAKPGLLSAGLVGQATGDLWTLERLEREYIVAVLERARWQQGVAADILGVDRRTIYRKLKRYREEGHLPELEPNRGPAPG